MDDESYIGKRIASAFGIGETEKGRRYVSDPSEAPDDVNVQQGEQGGYFYETDSGGDEDVPGDAEDTQEEIRGWGGTHDWSREVQDRAENLGEDYINEARDGGAYEHQDAEDVAERARNQARQYAINFDEDVDPQEFADEVEAFVEGEVENIRRDGPF